MYIELDLAKTVTQQAGTIDGYIGIDPAQLTAAVKRDDEQATKEAMAKLFKIAWAQYDSLELETEIGEVSFKLDSVTVSVTERKLRATWSPELAQDVSAFHNIDAEAELTAILSEQIAAEIDGFSAFNAARLTGPDGNEMDTEEFLASLKVILRRTGTRNSLPVSTRFLHRFRSPHSVVVQTSSLFLLKLVLHSITLSTSM